MRPSAPRYWAALRPLVLVAVGGLFRCTIQVDGGGPPPPAPPPPAPVVVVHEPRAGATVFVERDEDGDDDEDDSAVAVNFEVNNFNLKVDCEEAEENCGHIHVFVDDGDCGEAVAISSPARVKLTCSDKEGDHDVRLALHDDDHRVIKDKDDRDIVFESNVNVVLKEDDDDGGGTGNGGQADAGRGGGGDAGVPGDGGTSADAGPSADAGVPADGGMMADAGAG